MKEVPIAFDSNTLTYFLTANGGNLQPGVLAPEVVAALRLFLYLDGIPHILPQTSRETASIRDAAKRDEHLNWIWYHFEEVLPEWLDAAQVERRTQELLQWDRSGGSDCRMLAEAENYHVAVIISKDTAFRKRLQQHTRVKLRSAGDYWAELALPRGIGPVLEPKRGHPLFDLESWRW